MIFEGSGKQRLKRLAFFFLDMFVEESLVILSSLLPNKTPEIILLRGPTRGLRTVGCYCFTSMEDFQFQATFLFHWHSILAPQVHEGLLQV